MFLIIVSYSDWEELSINDPGVTNFKYGSDDLLEIFKILNGKTVANRQVKIQNPWYFKAPLELAKWAEIPPTPPDPEADHVLIYPDKATGKVMAHKSNGQRVDLEGAVARIQDLTDVQFTDLTNNDALRYSSAEGKWINLAVTGAGEANTASNVGSAGIGVYKQKSGVNLQFKKINPASSKITVTDNAGVSQIDLDVAEANLTKVGNLTGLVKGNGASAFSAIANGTANQVLTMSGGNPTWQSPAGANAREDIACHWSEVMKKSASTTYANMNFIYDNDISTVNMELDNAVMNCDFTAKTQFRVQFAIRRDEKVAHNSPGTTVDDIKVVDSTNVNNVLFEKTGINSDTRQTVALTNLPAWATGAQTLVPMAKQESGSGAGIWCGDMIIWLK